MEVSIVVVSYKVPFHLLLALDSILKATKNIDTEIFVVDNASQDETSNYVQKYFPSIHFIQNKTNDGFSKANNKAIDLATGKYILLINPDTIVSETSIHSVINTHQSINKCGILGLRLIDGTGHFLPESKINTLTLKVAACKMLGHSNTYYNHTLSENNNGPTSTLVGAFMCFKKEDYCKLSGLDERYFMYGEDIDLCQQFTSAGYQNYYLGEQSIIHFKGESTLRNEVYFNRFFQSTTLFFKKHYSNSKFVIPILTLFFSLARRYKKFEMDKKEKPIENYNTIYFLTKNTDEKTNLVQQHFKQPVTIIDISTLNNYSFHQDMIIFNTRTIEYKTAIQFVINHRKEKNTYRFLHPKIDLLIGSDSSTTQAKIIFLHKK